MTKILKLFLLTFYVVNVLASNVDNVKKAKSLKKSHEESSEESSSKYLITFCEMTKFLS